MCVDVKGLYGQRAEGYVNLRAKGYMEWNVYDVAGLFKRSREITVGQ